MRCTHGIWMTAHDDHDDGNVGIMHVREIWRMMHVTMYIHM